MKHRKLIGFVFAAALSAGGFCVQAQQAKKVARIGLLSPFTAVGAAQWHEAFRQGLRQHGWVEGKNISIEYRYAEGKNDRLPELVADLIHLKVDLIVTSIVTDTLAAKKATKTIPIVMASAADPVATGLVDSLARPGGNITGLSQIAPELTGKRLELLKEVVPKLLRVAVLWRPKGIGSGLAWKDSQEPARELGLQLHSLEITNRSEFEKVFEEAMRVHAGALAGTPDPLFAGNLSRIAGLAAKNRLPSIFYLGEFVDFGGLMAYGPDRSDQFRRAAAYVDKILKGAKPGDLPVEQPTKFELAINLKAAKQIGLTIPPNVLARADRVVK
ncbi:MAG TPA: ABC transporter substrate-binding protein [Candidatus Binatia bacterium]|jgi:putative ABC transport system substrate-binding protein